jgi:hypothetical protein
MKPFSRLSAPNRNLPARFRELRLLLLSLFTFGLLLSLPSSEAVRPYRVESNRADHSPASTPFVVASHNLLRVVRSDFNDQLDAADGGQPVLLWLPSAIFEPAILAASLVLPVVHGLHPLPVSRLPGAPRGPPAFPL